MSFADKTNNTRKKKRANNKVKNVRIFSGLFNPYTMDYGVIKYNTNEIISNQK